MNINLEDLQRALANRYLSADIINEFQCMRTQTELMESIQQLMQRKGNNFAATRALNIDNLGSLDASSVQQINYTYNSSEDSLFKSKFTEEFEQSIITKALQEVKANCCEETYETIRQQIKSGKNKESEELEKRFEKVKSEKQQLATQLLIITLEKQNLDKELENNRKVISAIEDEKRSIKKKVDYVLKKQNQVSKLQSSITFQEKLVIQLRKKCERSKENANVNIQKLQALYYDLEEIWKGICNKMASVDCPSKCWKKDAMARARQKLTSQRALLREESAQLEKEYDIMMVVGNQFRKIFQEPRPEQNHFVHPEPINKKLGSCKSVDISEATGITNPQLTEIVQNTDNASKESEKK